MRHIVTSNYVECNTHTHTRTNKRKSLLVIALIVPALFCVYLHFSFSVANAFHGDLSKIPNTSDRFRHCLSYAMHTLNSSLWFVQIKFLLSQKFCAQLKRVCECCALFFVCVSRICCHHSVEVISLSQHFSQMRILMSACFVCVCRCCILPLRLDGYFYGLSFKSL